MLLERNSKSSNLNWVHGLKDLISNTNDDVKLFFKYYFASANPPESSIDSIVNEIMKNPKIAQVFSLSSTHNFTLKPQFEKRILKLIISKLETFDFYDVDEIYQKLCLITDSPTFDRIFVDFDNYESNLIIKERSEQLSSGTTGLSAWPAAFVLAEFLKLQTNVLKNKVVIELGSGCGFTGIACCKYCNVMQMYLTDFHEEVLEQLRSNVSINQIENAKVYSLDWMNFNTDELTDVPEVIIAADVVYDPEVLPGLAQTVRKLLNKPENVAYIACTVRNESTLLMVKNLLESNSLRIINTFLWSPNKLIFTSNDNSESLKYSESFPFSQGIHPFPVEILVIK